MKKAEAVLAVKFNTRHSAEELMTVCQEDLDIFKNIPGLVQKYYVTEESTGSVSGIYLFETKDDRKVFQASDLAKSIPIRYRVIPESLRAEEYDIAIILNDEELISRDLVMKA